MKMAKFQALYVLWLRHESMCGCSWRALAGNYYARYTFKNKLIPFKDREYYNGGGGNQIDGIILEEEAFSKLIPDPLIMEPVDLFECDLNRVHSSFNIKNHRNG